MTWRERNVAARERGYFTEEDRYAARDFGTCAVSEQAAKGMAFKLMKYTASVPADLQLATLGYNFFWKAVKANDFNEADRLLDAIEDRALQLKREAGSIHAPASERSEAS